MSPYNCLTKCDQRLFVVAAVCILAGQVTWAEDITEFAPENLEKEETTLVYGHAFFAKHPNAVTALDIIRRIPTGSRILASTRTDQRGFSANEDRILVDGRRITGKRNSSLDTLGRITLDQIERIEIIRGESPDIRVSSGEAVLNVVMISKERANSGSWRLMAEAVEGIDVGLNGTLTYSLKKGRLATVLSADRREQVRTFKLNERLFDASDTFTSQLEEVEKINFLRPTLSAGFTYELGNGDTLRANASYQDADYVSMATGNLSAPDPMDILSATGNASRHYDSGGPTWEFSGDFEKKLGDSLQMKLLGLYTENDEDEALGEDFLQETGNPHDDFQFFSHQFSSELIGRVGLTWSPKPKYELEFGTEVAINELDSESSFLLRQDNVLTEVPLPGSLLSIQEFRDESFLNFTYKPDARLSIDASLIAEYSEIELTDGGSETKRDFFFLKPAIDVRYNLTSRDQIQAQVARRVDQLQFADFAASASIDNQTFAGNTELHQQQRWVYEAGYERRFEDDGGRFMVKLRHHSISDFIALVPVDDGTGNLISAVGNAGDASLWQLVLEGSFRMKAIGVPNLVIEPRLLLNHTEFKDAFTGNDHAWADWPDHQLRIEVRHDIGELGLSYGGRLTSSSGVEVHDIKDRFEMKSELFYGVFVEYLVFSGVTLRADVNDLSNYDRGWNRFMFEDGTQSGGVTSRSLLEQREGLVYNIALSGSF